MAAIEAPMPSHMRVEPGSTNIAFGKWPEAATSTDIDPVAIAKDVIDRINQALSSGDTKAVADLFLEDSYLRDHLVNSWDLRTIKGKENIQKFLEEGCRLQQLRIDDSSAFRAPHVGAFDGGNVKGVEFFITLETAIGRGQGVLRLAQRDGKWFIWTIFLMLKELKGHEEPTRHRRVAGVSHGADQSRRNWLDQRIESQSFENAEPAVLVVGAGQGGLTIGSRLKMLGVPTLIIDTNDRVGDNWRKRYKALVLHDPVHYDHLPYLSFPSHWPIFTPKDKLGEWFESYAKSLELNIWMKTKLVSSSYDDDKKRWTVKLIRNKDDGSTEQRILHPRHVIQATGHSGKKNMPEIKGMQGFQGDLLAHSADFQGAKDDGQGRKAVVVGACNSSHDICQDYYEKGYDITMVQRSSTCVVSSSAIIDIGLKGLYDEDGPPTEDADLWFFAYPGEVLKTLQKAVGGIQAQHDDETLKRLQQAGFNVDKGPDDAGLLMKYIQRGGGYYIDVGASQLIIDGKIKIKSGQEIVEVLPHGLKFADGTELDADEIIFATGYQNMRTEARTIFGDDVYDRVRGIWGLDQEGEMRTIWRRSGHPGFWFMGGNLALCRYYSRLLALQIKALEEGLYRYDDR